MADTADRVQETTTSTGLGSLALSGPVTGYRTFDTAFGTGAAAEFYYCVDGGATGQWEVGKGHLSTPTDLVRVSVLASSAGGALVDFSAGSKSVFATLPARMARGVESSGVAQGATAPAPPAGEFPIIHSSVAGRALQWNGTSWARVNGVDELASSSGVCNVDWFIPTSLYSRLVVDVAGVLRLDFSTTYTRTSVGSSDPIPGETVYLRPAFSSLAAEGIYVLGSTADLSSVPLTRHPDWPATRPIPEGFQVYSKRACVDGLVDGFLTSGTVFPADDRVEYFGPLDGVIEFTNLQPGATMPGGLALNTAYFPVEAVFGAAKLSLSRGGSPIAITTAGVDGSFGGICESQQRFQVEDGQTSVLTVRSNGGSRPRPYRWADNVTAGEPLTLQSEATSTGGFSLVLGAGASAIGFTSTALGPLSRAAGSGTAVGQGSTAANDNTVSIGPASRADEEGSVVVGAASQASGGGLALGSSSFASAGEFALADNQSWEEPSGFGARGARFGYKQTRLYTFTENATPKSMRRGGSGVIRQSLERAGLIKGQARAHSSSHSASWEFEILFQQGDPVQVSSWVRRTGGTNTAIGKGLKLKLLAGFDPVVEPLYWLEIQCVGHATEPVEWVAVFDRFKTSVDQYSAVSYPADWQLEAPGIVMLPASESLLGGRLVNVWNDAGAAKVRYADASTGRSADGYVLQDTALGETIDVHLLGENPFQAGLAIGPQFLGASGNVTATPPGTGNLVQRVGFALSASRLLFQRETPIQT